MNKKDKKFKEFGLKNIDEYYTYLDDLLESYYFNSNKFILKGHTSPFIIKINKEDYNINDSEDYGCSAFLSGLGVFLMTKKNQEQPPIKNIEFPKIVIVHEKIFVPANSKKP